jgi:hypothetical protein
MVERAGWEANRSAGASRSLEILGYTARESPRAISPRRLRRSSPEPDHATAGPRDEGRRADWYQRGSSAPSFVDSLTDALPCGILHSRLKSLAFECRFAEPKTPATLSFGNDTPEPLLHVCPNGRPFFGRESLAKSASDISTVVFIWVAVSQGYGYMSKSLCFP